MKSTFGTYSAIRLSSYVNLAILQSITGTDPGGSTTIHRSTGPGDDAAGTKHRMVSRVFRVWKPIHVNGLVTGQMLPTYNEGGLLAKIDTQRERMRKIGPDYRNLNATRHRALTGSHVLRAWV